MNKELPFHFNDITSKYSAMAFRKRQHKYLGLPGEYIRRYPNEVVLRNLESGRMDELYSVTGNLLINLEDESENVTEKTMQKFSKYRVFDEFIYSMAVLTAVICRKDPKNFPKEYQLSPTDILRPWYIHFPQEELWEKYENLINKIKQKIVLNDDEALDIAFLPKFISIESAPFVTESLARIFKDTIIPDSELKRDVALILGIMVLKHKKDKIDELMEEIGMEEYVDEITEIVYSEFGEELEKKDEAIKGLTQELTMKNRELIDKNKEITDKNKEIKSKNKEIKSKNKEINLIKKGIKELSEIKDLNSPKAREILNSLILLN